MVLLLSLTTVTNNISCFIGVLQVKYYLPVIHMLFCKEVSLIYVSCVTHPAFDWPKSPGEKLAHPSCFRRVLNKWDTTFLNQSECCVTKTISVFSGRDGQHVLQPWEKGDPLVSVPAHLNKASIYNSVCVCVSGRGGLRLCTQFLVTCTSKEASWKPNNIYTSKSSTCCHPDGGFIKKLPASFNTTVLRFTTTRLCREKKVKVLRRLIAAEKSQPFKRILT